MNLRNKFASVASAILLGAMLATSMLTCRVLVSREKDQFLRNYRIQLDILSEPATEDHCEYTAARTGDEKGTYGYLLRMRISTKHLADSLFFIRLQVAVMTLGCAACAVMVAFFAASRLTARLERVASAVARCSNLDSGVSNAVRSNDEVVRIEDFVESCISRLRDVAESEKRAERQRGFADLAAKVAHDLRAPLAALDVALSRPSNEPGEARDIMRAATERMRLIVGDLLAKRRDADKPMANSATLHECAEAVGQIVTEVMCVHEGTRRIEFDNDCPASLDGSRVPLAVHELQRIYSNLIVNAIEATESRGDVSTGLRVEAENLVLEIKDTGAGMPQHVLAKVGKQEITEGKENGNGLGVFSAAEKIKSIGGDMHIASELGKGTTITIRMPFLPGKEAGL